MKVNEERHAKHFNGVVSVDACEDTANALQKQGGLTDTEIQDLRVFHGKMVVPPTVGLLFRGMQVGDGCGEKCLFAKYGYVSSGKLCRMGADQRVIFVSKSGREIL